MGDGLIDKEQIPEGLPSPLGLGVDAVKKVGGLALRPLNSRVRGEQLAREHEQNEIERSVREMKAREDDPVIVQLSGQQILSVTARGLEGQLPYSRLSSEDRILWIKTIMNDYFPGWTFDNFNLSDQHKTTLRHYFPEY
jgi:hypothetical protein